MHFLPFCLAAFSLGGRLRRVVRRDPLHHAERQGHPLCRRHRPVGCERRPQAESLEGAPDPIVQESQWRLQDLNQPRPL
jgi:hypothetical protein